MLDDHTALVTVIGEIDVDTAPRFGESLADAVNDTHTRGLIVDLSAVSFLDSTALTALVRCFELQRARLERMCLVSDDTRLTSLLEVTRLDQILHVAQNHDQALDYISTL